MMRLSDVTIRTRLYALEFRGHNLHPEFAAPLAQ